MGRLSDWMSRWPGEGGGLSIEHRLFRILTLLASVLALAVTVPVNVLTGIPWVVNAWVMVFGAGCLWCHLGARAGTYRVWLLFWLFLTTLDAVWFPNGGSQGSVVLYFFAAALYLTIFFGGWARWAALAVVVVNVVALLLIERSRPALAWAFPSRDARFLDLGAGFAVSIVICVLILWGVIAAYHLDRKRLLAALESQRQSESHFRALVMNAPIPIAVAEQDGRIDYLNHQFEQVLGYTGADLPDIDAWWLKAYPDPQVRELASARWSERCAAALVGDGLVPASEFPVVCKDGHVARLEIQAAHIGGRWLVMFLDLSERLRAEEVLRQAQKLESLGVLAGGIAHDFNNLLSAMLGNLNLAQMKLPPGAVSAPYLENIGTTVRKAAELTRQMLAYSGKGRFLVEPMDLNRLVAEITHLLAVSISKKVRLEYELESGLPAIEADSAQVQQVVMNLVTNASEAIGEAGGVITIATWLRVLTEPEVKTTFAGQGVAPGRHVVLQVKDTGCGMSPESLARIFDPFYSTKGSGRGLGLSAMLGILRGHGAGIAIQSTVGQGSDFQILFRASSAAVPESGQTDPGIHRNAFHGKVLLVDDEADLRFSFGSMFQHLGFQVVAARDGHEALQQFRPREFALVFMDLTMPRMGGMEAFLQMKARDPEVRVVLTSGYNERESIEPEAALRPAGFLQKPFSLEALIRVLEHALG